MSGTDQDPEPDHRPGNDIAVVSLILSQMNQMKADLVGAIREHSDAETERWARHEAEHGRHEAEHDRVLVAIKHNNDRIDAILEADERSDLVLRARLEPVKTAAGFLKREWRTIMLVTMILANAIAQIIDRTRFLGP